MTQRIVCQGGGLPSREDVPLNAMHIVAALLGLGLLVYLGIALLMPERFQ
jgi:K+-transporting ATPase KdpF subunit